MKIIAEYKDLQVAANGRGYTLFVDGIGLYSCLYKEEVIKAFKWEVFRKYLVRI